MATYETYKYKGREYKFRLDGDEPKLEKFELRDSDYYKEKQKNLSWVNFVLAYPILVGIAAVVYAALGGEGDGRSVMLLLMFPYFFLAYIAGGNASEVKDVLEVLKARAERVEYTEAYKAWIKDRVE